MRANWLILFFFSCLLVCGAAPAQSVPPKIPDPFCSPTDFFNYLNLKNHDRVLYVLNNCSNIDLKDKGPRGETFASVLATTTWDDIFELSLTRSDADFKFALVPLITNRKFEWLKKLAPLQSISFGTEERAALANMFPHSREFILHLLELKKIDLNAGDGSKDSILISALKNQKLDLVEFLRTIPEVKQTNFYSQACGLPFYGYPPEVKEIYRKYFMQLYAIEKIDPNLMCSNGSILAVNVLNPDIDKDLRISVLANSTIDLSKPTYSIKMVMALISTFPTHGDKFFAAVLGNPTFNLADVSIDKENFWHVLMHYYKDGMDKTAFYNYFDKLSEDTINDRDATGVSPLYYLIKSNSVINLFYKKFLDSTKLDVNKIDDKISALLNAAISNNTAVFASLLARGADKVNVGDLKNNQSYIASKMTRNILFFNTFFNHPDLNINMPIDSSPQNSQPLFGTIMANRLETYMAEFIPKIIDDPRFDATQIEKFIVSHLDNYFSECTAAQVWARSNIKDKKTLMKLLAKSSNENLSKVCVFNTMMGLAAEKGDVELIDYLYAVRKLPETGFNSAYRHRQWAVVEYFLNKGLKPAYDIDFYRALIADEKYELLKKIVKDPAFDPNKVPKSNEDLLLITANEKGKEVFDLIINNPKIVIGARVLPFIRLNRGHEKPNYFIETVFSKFTINNPEDKITAIKVAFEFNELDYPVSYLDKLIKLKNFDINAVVPKDIDSERNSYTLYAYLMGTSNAAYLDSVLKIKTLNPNTVADIMPITELFFNGLDEFPFQKKYFDAYYAHPLVKIALPKIGGTPFFDYLKYFRGDSIRAYIPLKIAALYLSSPKFKFTKDELVEIFALRKNISNHGESLRGYKMIFLNAFFSYPTAKPLAQWGSVIENLYFDSAYKEEIYEEEVKFIIKYGAEIDLNYTNKEVISSIISTAISGKFKVLFDYLISNPKVNVTNLLDKFDDSDYYINMLLSKRISDIPQEDFLNSIVHQITRYPKEGKLPDSTIPTIKKVYPYIKSFDTFTAKISSGNPAALALFERWKNEDEIMPLIYNRILKEDSTIAKNVTGVLVPALIKGNFDLVNLLVQKGYNLFDSVEGKPIMVIITAKKSLPALKYLASKGLDANSKCAGQWDCNGTETPFGVAMNLGWYEGADYLVSLKADPRILDTKGESSMFAAVSKNDINAVKYLVSKNVSPNGNGSLVKAIMDQNDDVLEIFLNDEKTDPNSKGMDVSMKRFTYPLIEAARYNNIDYVKALLLFPNINKGITDGLGYRAIDWAATNQYVEIVELLKK